MPMDSFSSEGILRRLIRLPYLPLYVGVLNAAVELDVFSDLTQRKSVRELSEESICFKLGVRDYCQVATN